MGLDTTHDAWHGPYSSFNRFRFWLAKQIGINLSDYAGYNEKATLELSTIEHDIMPLLNHSDCDGHLTPDECKRIVKGLRQILNATEDDQPNNPFSNYKLANRFLKGARKAALRKENLEFH